MTSLPTPPAVGSALDLIGKTPMVELTEFDTGPCRLFVKLESANPGGSIKDRIALSMIEAAEADGRLKPGGTLVEATAGNTGLGLAQVGPAEGLQAAAGGARQDGAREDPAPAGHGRRRAHHPLGRRQGPPGVLPGHGRGAGRARSRRRLHQPVRQPRQSAGARDHHRPGNPGADGRRRRRGGGRRRLRRHAHRPRPLLRQGLAEDRRWCWPIRSARSWPRWSTRGEHVKPGSWVVEGIGEDFVPAQLRPRRW